MYSDITLQHGLHLLSLFLLTSYYIFCRRVYEEVGSSPQAEDAPYEDRLQSVVVSPHRARKHRRDSSPEDRKHSKVK